MLRIFREKRKNLVSLHLDRKPTNLAVVNADPWWFFRRPILPGTSKQIRLLNLDASEIPYQQHVITFRGLFHLPTYQVKQQPRFLKHVTINHHEPSWTIINYHQPSSTIINHHQPSSTIINHHQPCLFCKVQRLVIVDPLDPSWGPQLDPDWHDCPEGLVACMVWGLTTWWFQPLRKICSSKWVHLPPIFRVKIPQNNLSCHHLEDDQSDGPIVSAVEILLVFCGAPFGLPCPSKSNVFQWQLEVPGTVQSNRRERDTLWML